MSTSIRSKHNFLFNYLPASYLIRSLSYSLSFLFIAKKCANSFYRLCMCYYNVLFSDLQKQSPDLLILLCFFCLNLSALSLFRSAPSIILQGPAILWHITKWPEAFSFSNYCLWSSKTVKNIIYYIKSTGYIFWNWKLTNYMACFIVHLFTSWMPIKIELQRKSNYINWSFFLDLLHIESMKVGILKCL